MSRAIDVPAADVERVRDAMAATPRADYLPPAVRSLAGADRPVMLGWGATNSQPSTVARMLALLGVRAGDRVLDVGSGSAWTTGILANLVGGTGEVVGVERIPELVAYGRERLAEQGIEATIERATPGRPGLPDRAPFDRILVSAEWTSLPQALVAQLGEGGRLVAPVAGVMTVIDVRHGRAHVREDAGRYAFVPFLDT